MSKFLKVLFPIVMIVALVSINLGSTPDTSEAREAVEVRIFVGVGTGYRAEQQDAQNALADQWNAEHEDIKVVFEFHDNTTARDELLTRVAAGDPPAIVGPAGVRSIYETSNLWADIGDLIDRDAADLNLDDFDTASFDIYKLGDKRIAVPLGVYPSMMFVNETLFNEAGVELPPLEYGAWTWDDVRDLGMQLTRDANGVYLGEAGFDPGKIEVFGYDPFWANFRRSFELFSPTDAGVAIDGDTVMATFNQEAMVQACEWFHQGIYVDQFVPDADTDTAIGTGVSNPFASGRFAMGVSHTWMLGQGMKDGVEAGFADDWNVYPVPTAPNGITTAPIHADTFAIMAGYSHREEAWQVLKWLTSPEVSLVLNQVYGAMPARLSIRSEWEAAMLDLFPQLDFDVIYSALNYLDAPNHEGYMPNYAKAWDTLERFWGDLRADPGLDCQSALDNLNSEVQIIFNEPAAE
jgi:multiple sugar transport system substrate-binding protein